MEKIEFKDFPITDTPIDADNLNLLQNNIENEIQTKCGVINNAEAVIGNETDTYSASSTYALGSLVIYDGLLYKCTTAITVAEAWTIAHWTQVSLTSLANDGDVYSTSEQIVGKWIDGKPIYRKIITGVHNDAEVLVSNVSSLIKVYGQADNGTGLVRYIPWTQIFQNKNYSITVELFSNNIQLNSKSADVSAPTSSNTKIVIEYTKTTD